MFLDVTDVWVQRFHNRYCNMSFRCCNCVILMLHFFERFECFNQHYVAGDFHLIFDGRLSAFFNIFLMLQTLNFDIADVEFRYYRRCF
jgi:hypothetical protein